LPSENKVKAKLKEGFVGIKLEKVVSLLLCG
jgi:hypothetical protein